MSEEHFQGDDAFLEWQQERARRVEKNEQAFRAHNERREQLEKRAISAEEAAPFVCECADVGCWGVMDLTVGEFEDAHQRDDRFSVLPGHVMPEFETVVEKHDHYWVVEKLAPDEIEQRVVADSD